MKTIINALSIILLIVGFSLTSCVKQQFDVPPSNCDTLDTIQPNITIRDLKAMLPNTQDTLRITQDLIIAGYVISTDQYGNFYKELVIQDSTAGISILIDQTYLYTIYPKGQKVLVKLNGLYLGRQYGVVKIGSTYDDNGVIKFGRIQGPEVIDMHVIKTCQNQPQEPMLVTIPQIKNQTNDELLYRYVRLDSVQFSDQDTGTTWANPYADPPQAVNHLLVDVRYNSIIVRTSGYASFAAQPIPNGSGTFVGILGKYNSDYQLYVNSPDELDMDNPRFNKVTLMLKDYSDGSLTSGGWQNINVQGDVDWYIATQYGNPAPSAAIKNYINGSNVACETWYVSPSLDLSQASNPAFRFDNAHGYSGNWLEVYYSTDWDGDPATLTSATWTKVDFQSDHSSTFWQWVNSGVIPLPKEANVHIGFKYTGTNTDGMTWEIDNIEIFDVQ